jgi:RNA polymerase sigma-70 factor (ECF subfamily)
LPRSVAAEHAVDLADAKIGVEPARRDGSSSSSRAPVGEPSGSEPLGRPPSRLTDRELLVGLRTGSEPHFNELYRRYFQRIYSFVYSRRRNHADAEEVVQETFTAVFRSIEAYRGTSSLLSWIYGIAKNTLNNSLRRQQLEARRIESLPAEVVCSRSALSNCTPEELLSLRRYAEAVDDRLGTVSSWQSEIFAMRHLDDMSIREISSKTHRSSDAVRSSLYRVKRLFLEAAEPPVSSPDPRPAPPRG